MSKNRVLTKDLTPEILEFEGEFVSYPFLNKMHRLIEENKARSKRAKEPRCLCLKGRQGAGKSTIAKTYAIQHLPFEDEDGWIIPVLYVPTPDEATRKGLCTAMLYALGDPAWDIGSRDAKTLRLKGLIEDCQVEVVILDDLQHVLRETGVEMKRAAEWLKCLIKMTKATFVIIGTEDEIGNVLTLDKQLARLFGNAKSLAPFHWDQGFAEFIKHAESTIGMSLSNEIERDDLLYRIHYATEGSIGPIMDLLNDAAACSTKHGSNSIRLEDLSNAYEEYWREYLGKKYNPFLISQAERVDLEKDLKEQKEKAEALSAEELKQPQNSVDHVLKARST